MFPGGVCIKERKIGGNAFVQGGACIHAFGSSFSPEFFSCSFADGVEPFCLTLRSQQFWSILSRSCRVVALALGDRDFSHSSDPFLAFVQLLITCLSFSFFSFLFFFFFL
jgi:hypothetical protein